MLNPNSGLLSLAATARHGLAAEQLWDHAQPLIGGLDVLVGLAGAEQAAGLTGLWPMLGQAFATLAESPNGAADVIADCGRIGAGLADPRTVAARRPGAAGRPRPPRRTWPGSRDRAGALSAKLHGSQRGAAALGYPPIGVLLIADPGDSARLAAPGQRDAGRLADLRPGGRHPRPRPGGRRDAQPAAAAAASTSPC